MAKAGVFTYDFFPFTGGMGRHVHTMYQALAGRDVLFFSAADNQLPGHIGLAPRGVLQFKHLWLSCWLLFKFDSLLSRYRLEVVNIHSGPGGLFLLKPLPVPVVVTCHHTYWQQAHYIPSQFWKRIFIPLEKMTYRLASKIICDTSDTKQILVDRYGIPESKITVIHCVVDTGKFKPGNIAKERHSLLYVGRIDKRKGLEFLIRSMRIVADRIPDALLSICGTGADSKKMMSLTARLNLERNIRFLGFVPDVQLPGLYQRAQCAVLPSVFEGFGLTVIESLACGTRVIGSDVDGLRETLADAGYGRLVPYGDHFALAEAIIDELQDPRGIQVAYKMKNIKEFGDSYQQVFAAVVQMAELRT